jgi:hypothetical protein
MVATGQDSPRAPANLVVESADYPVLSRSASRASQRGQRLYRCFISVNLALLVIGATLVGLEQVRTDQPEEVLVALVALAMLGAMATNLINRWRRDDDAWFQGRAVAESVKTASWRYMMRTEPFTADSDFDREFSRRLSDILSDCHSLRLDAGGMGSDARQITGRMREVRRLGVRRRLEVYLRDRLDRQIIWYRDKAERNRQLANRWFWASFGAESTAIVIAFLAIPADGSTSDLIELVGIIAAVGAAFAAWAQLGRHSELNKSYSVAAHELQAIKDTARSVNTEAELQSLVRAGEDAISREHTMWVAKHE